MGDFPHLIYDPKIKPVMHKSFAAYKNKQSTTINHFYEKLLLLHKLSPSDNSIRAHSIIEVASNRSFIQFIFEN